MTILAGTFSEATDSLVVKILFNPLNVSVTMVENIGAGANIVTIDQPILNSDMPKRWYTSDSSGNIYSVHQDSPITFIVNCFDPSGIPVGNVLSANEFQIEIY